MQEELGAKHLLHKLHKTFPDSSQCNLKLTYFRLLSEDENDDLHVYWV